MSHTNELPPDDRDSFEQLTATEHAEYVAWTESTRVPVCYECGSPDVSSVTMGRHYCSVCRRGVLDDYRDNQRIM
jgi:hypothetical protein